MSAWTPTIAAAAALLSACGPATTHRNPDFVVHDSGVVILSDATFARQADLPARIGSTIDVALGYWGGTWDRLAGVTITLVGAPQVVCDGVPSASGCYDGDIRISTSDFGTTWSCVEQTVLVHEVGHAVIGDAGHADPRWMDFGAVAAQLAGRVGYAAGSEVDCPLDVNVWRHPPSR